MITVTAKPSRAKKVTPGPPAHKDTHAPGQPQTIPVMAGVRLYVGTMSVGFQLRSK
jgi:hypothetical protein